MKHEIYAAFWICYWCNKIQDCAVLEDSSVVCKELLPWGQTNRTKFNTSKLSENLCKNLTSRMPSSRMRTACLLTVSHSIRIDTGPGGGCLPLVLGVSASCAEWCLLLVLGDVCPGQTPPGQTSPLGRQSPLGRYPPTKCMLGDTPPSTDRHL